MTHRLRALILITGAAQAPLATAEDSNAPRELPTVTVTATKQTQSYEKVPASVSSVDKDFIRDRAASNFLELSDYTPNVTMNVSGSAGQFIVRGLGTPDTNLGFDPSVGLVADGVYYGRSNFLSAFFNDIDRFEVLRGPQGTLFGKNSTAGLFNVVSQKPDADWRFDGTLLARGYGDLSLQPHLSIPVTDHFGLRLSANIQHGSQGELFNTFLNRPENNNNQDTFRLRGRWVGDSGVSVDGQVFHSHQYLNNSNFLFYTLTPSMLSAIRSFDPNFDDNPLHRRNSTNFASAEDAQIEGASATVEVPLPEFAGMQNLRLTAISAWAQSLAKKRDIDADFSPIPFITDQLAEPSRYRQLSQELRFSGSGKDFFGYGYGINFIAGMYLLKSSYGAADLFSLESLGGAAVYCTAAEPGSSNCNGLVPGGAGTVAQLLSGPISALTPFLGPSVNDQNVRTRLAQQESSYAGFGQFEYSFLPSWAAIGGIRYGSERKDGDLSAIASSPLVMAIADSENHQTRLSRTEQDYSPKGGIRYSPSKNVSAYLTWARGYKSGGFNGLPLRSTQNEYGPERASSYELGGKAKLLNNRLRLSASVFTTDFDNLQVSTFQGNRFIVLNAAAARSKGAEIDAQWLPEWLPFLFLRASAGYADARYLRYPNAPCYADAPTNCTGQDLSGQRLPFGSKWTASITPDVFFPVGNGLKGAVGMDVVYRSDRFLDVDDDPRKLQPSTTLINLHLTLNDNSKQWAITLAVRNLTNLQYYDQRLGQPLAPGNFASSGTSPPRTFLQSITYSF